MRWTSRLLLFPVLAAAAVAAACTADDADAGGISTLPPGMLQDPYRTNADAPPPPVPFDAATPVVTAEVLQRYPHDTGAYTQGLVLAGNRLYESTGRYGLSDVREVTLSTGAIARRTRLDQRFFAEGLALHGGKLLQLTWREGQGFRYEPSTLAVVDSFTWNAEGWGLASDGTRLYATDGSARVAVLRSDLSTERTITVTEAGRPVPALNELEWVKGELWASIFQTDYIARINPETGAVVGYVNVGGILTGAQRADVDRRGGTANGIAFDAASNTLLVTGKLWPVLAKIRVP